MRKNFIIHFSILHLILITSWLRVYGQGSNEVKRPKMIVGIIVDQMRWDFLYKYSNRYTKDGFNRLINQGHTCENAYIPYAPSVTAAGHACVYTGTVPAINGIVGNEWFDNIDKRIVYCAEDTSATPVGNTVSSSAGKMSPKNMWTTSVSDELRIATNFKGKSVGVCIKDRGAIFPAGHTANAAYWYDVSTGNWISSSYYMKELPSWLKKMNEDNFSKKYYEKDWTTLYPKNTYSLSDSDEQIYEGKFRDNPSSSLPYKLSNIFDKNKSMIVSTPHGNTMTIEVAKKAIEHHELGKDEVTDILCLSLSSPDYIGHQFGPNSIEIEDTYLKLDQELASLLNYLDKEVGMGAYTIFLSADHGVAHIPGYNEKNKLPGRLANGTKFIISIKEDIEKKFGIKDAILTEQNNQIYLDHEAIKKSKFKIDDIEDYIIEELEKDVAVLQVYKISKLNNTIMNSKVRQMYENGFTSSRSGDIQVIYKSGYFDGRLTGTTHGSHYAYDTHIPVVFFGNGIKQGKTYRNVYMTDIAPTISSLLKIQMPSGTTGEAIYEALK